jgi:nitronate monooxygenase
MAGACPPGLAAAIANAGGAGALGALLMSPDEIVKWAEEFRAASAGPYQINLWIPDDPPQRDAVHETSVREFLARWGPVVPPEAADAPLKDFSQQCESILRVRPSFVSSIMGLYPPPMIERFRDAGIPWFACVTTLEEARLAERAGADALVVQGVEAGGHRGSFDEAAAEAQGGTLLALLPRIADNVDLPLIATGGIGDARGAAAALILGASAVQIGTAFLRCPESKIASAWSNALIDLEPEATAQTRAFSGRLGRSVRTDYVRAANAPEAPRPAPYPIQRALTAAMRKDAVKDDRLAGIQAWAGQAGAFARRQPAAELAKAIWTDARRLLP